MGMGIGMGVVRLGGIQANGALKVGKTYMCAQIKIALVAVPRKALEKCAVSTARPAATNRITAVAAIPLGLVLALGFGQWVGWVQRGL